MNVARRLTRAAVAVSLLGSTLAWAQSPPLELRGIVIGTSSIDDVQSVFRGAMTSSGQTAAFVTVSAEVRSLCGASPSSSCMESAIDNLRVAGGAAGSYRFAAGADGKIESMLVTFPKSGYATAKAGVVGKYGKPTSQRVRTMQNRMGGTFSGEELSWDLPQGAIRLSELADKVDESLLVMESRAIADKAAAEAKNRVRDAPSKL